MDTCLASERILRGVLLTLVVLFFLFPIFWVFLMSFQTNEHDPAHPALRCSSRRRSPTTRR